MNKPIFIFILFLGLAVFSQTLALAAAYYVRPDGGTPEECSGTADAAYPGSGSAVDCAFNHPRYALGWGCGNAGNNCANAGVMHAGDTLYISGDDPANGGQAQYEIGYDDGENNATPGCAESYPYDCTLGNLPAGLSALQPSSIIGTGQHKPQLWGTQRLWQILNANNNHLVLQNLDITDHASCAYNSPDKGCNYDGPYPYGPWALDGLNIGGDDVHIIDVYVHGMGRYGINTDNLGSAVFTRLRIIGNGYGGFTTGTNAVISGTLTFDQPVIEYNGCVESYPLNNDLVMDSPSNLTDCFGQNQSGYGDGLAFGNVGHGGAGNWSIQGPGSISFNTQDGLDTLHGNGDGNIFIDKMLFEGNAGNQVKMNALNSRMTNSVVIGDCGWWLGAAVSSPGFKGGDICRALGDAVVFNVTNHSHTSLENNTILSNGNISLESSDINGSGCDGSTSISLKNNVVLGGYAWIDDTSFNSAGGNALTSYIYNAGSNGDGAGSCGNLKWDQLGNTVYHTRNNNHGCSGFLNACGKKPDFADKIPMGQAGGRADTYYQGTSANSLLGLKNNPFNALSKNITSGKPAAALPQIKYNPEIVITRPVKDTMFPAGSNVAIIAAASEINGTIAHVNFYYNGMNLLGTVSRLPYEYMAEKVALGTYSIIATATDTEGRTTVSKPVLITVSDQKLPPAKSSSPQS